MTVNILAVGDVVGQTGLNVLKERLKPLQKEKKIAFTVVNGENANVVGITPTQADAIFAAGADVITLGNHTWTRWELQPYLENKTRILRPANFAPQCPGRGDFTFNTNFGPVRVINLMGRFTLDSNTDNPFPLVDALLSDNQTRIVLVDFHAEATSEKLAMAYYLDGRVSALWGTHTHVPTADEEIFPKGTGYQTDLGMTGPCRSVLGIRPEQSVETFLGGLPGRYQTAEGPCKLQGTVFSLDDATGLCVAVERLELR